MTTVLNVCLKVAILLIISFKNTIAQPVLVKPIPDASSNFVTAGDFLYFTSNDSLFRSDGTESGTILLKSGLRFEHPPRFTEYKGLLLFIVFKSPDTHERQIWRSDGTSTGTFPLLSLSYSVTDFFGTAGDLFYFGAGDPVYGVEIFRSDGTTSGTSLVKDINPGANNAFPTPLAALGDYFYFGADNGTHGLELWKTNGTASGTVMVKDINPGPGSGVQGATSIGFENRLYFSGINADTGSEPWVSDGTTSGTTLLKELAPGEESSGSIVYGKVEDGWLYFSETSVAPEDEEFPEVDVALWRTDGTTIGTTRIKSFTTRCAMCTIGDYHIYNNNLYFFLRENIDRDVLYTTDGTTTGTRPVFTPANTGVFVGVLAGELLFFDWGNYDHTALYRTDGTLSETDIVRRIISGQVNFAKIGDKVYFTDHDAAYDPSGGYSIEDDRQLFQSDGTIASSIRSIGGGSFPGSDNLISLNGKLMFTTKNLIRLEGEDNRLRLWLLDPSKPFEESGTLTLVNADTDADLQILNEGDVVSISSGSSYNIRFNPVNTPGSVVFKHQGKIVRRDNTAPYTLAGDNNGDYLAWNGAISGTHRIEATAYSEGGGTGTVLSTEVVNFTLTNKPVSCRGSGSILREYWRGIPGNYVSSIPVDQPPTGNGQLLSFEAPMNAGFNYGARIRGYICPPITGNYIFRIASNDGSELWLSTDDNPANKQRIAYTRYATNPRQWDKYPTQRSGEIWLVAGTRYYIEALHKQGGGTDHIAVEWQMPVGGFTGPISGYYLSPFSGGIIPEVKITNLTAGEQFYAPANIRIAGSISNMPGWHAIEFYNGETQLARFGTGDTFEFTWERVGPGTYPLRIVVTNDLGQRAETTVTVVVASPCAASGTITRERWNNITGNSVGDIPISTTPTTTTEVTSFETQSSGRNYGARIRGFICPPITGDYVFWIASNDQSELWMSTDDDPLNRQRIAYASSATDFRQWTRLRTQRSSPVRLTQGKRYYIEALHKQGVGSDHLSVGWQLPDGTLERPIGPSRLSPFSQQNDHLSQLMIPAAGSTDIDPLVIKLETRMVEGAKRYTVEVNDQPDFSGVSKLVISGDDYQNRFIMKDLNAATTYYARVKTDVSGFGPVTSFRTRDPITRMRLWGIATYGGENNVGTVFSYSIDDNQFVKHYDQPVYWGDYYNEERLRGPLIPGPNGIFYGHREENYGSGMFEIDAQGNLEWWEGYPYFYDSELYLASNSYIYSTTNDTWVPGIIDKLDIENKSLRLDLRMHFFTHFSGPSTPLIELSDGYIYGARGSGGVNEGGFIYRFRLDGSGFKILHYFSDEVGGMSPHGGLVEHNGLLYGTTTSGGTHGIHGTIFSIKTDGTLYKKLHDFNGINGSHPNSELTVMNDVLYGTTDSGGASGMGTVFRIHPNGTGYSVLHSFNGADGADPSRGLVHDQNGNLYGMTTSGGSENMGVIFKINIPEAAFTKLFDFTPESGGTPDHSLVIREDTYNADRIAQTASLEESRINVAIHPNPSTDNFRIQVHSTRAKRIQLVVMDQYGQTVTSYEVTNDTPMQFGTELKRGLYILQIIQGEEITTRRLVKK